MPELQGMPHSYRRPNVESLQYVEDSHVLCVFSFRLAQSLQDHHRKSWGGGVADGDGALCDMAYRPQAIQRLALRRRPVSDRSAA